MSTLWDELGPLVEEASFVLVEIGQFFNEAKVAPSGLISIRPSSLVYFPFDVILGSHLSRSKCTSIALSTSDIPVSFTEKSSTLELYSVGRQSGSTVLSPTPLTTFFARKVRQPHGALWRICQQNEGEKKKHLKEDPEVHSCKTLRVDQPGDWERCLSHQVHIQTAVSDLLNIALLLKTFSMHTGLRFQRTPRMEDETRNQYCSLKKKKPLPRSLIQYVQSLCTDRTFTCSLWRRLRDRFVGTIRVDGQHALREARQRRVGKRIGGHNAPWAHGFAKDWWR